MPHTDSSQQVVLSISPYQNYLPLILNVDMTHLIQDNLSLRIDLELGIIIGSIIRRQNK